LKKGWPDLAARKRKSYLAKGDSVHAGTKKIEPRKPIEESLEKYKTRPSPLGKKDWARLQEERLSIQLCINDQIGGGGGRCLPWRRLLGRGELLRFALERDQDDHEKEETSKLGGIILILEKKPSNTAIKGARLSYPHLPKKGGGKRPTAKERPTGEASISNKNQ